MLNKSLDLLLDYLGISLEHGNVPNNVGNDCLKFIGLLGLHHFHNVGLDYKCSLFQYSLFVIFFFFALFRSFFLESFLWDNVRSDGVRCEGTVWRDLLVLAELWLVDLLF